MRIALAGNPNSGKTTMYNALTGKNEKVGNWAGVTVDKKEHIIKRSYSAGSEELVAVDLPGAYSLSPFTGEESITSSYIRNESPDVIINIVDSTNLARSLFFTTQLLELGIPTVVALNKTDVAKRRSNSINTSELSRLLGCPVTETVSASGKGLQEAVKAAISVAGSIQIAPYTDAYSDKSSRDAVRESDRLRFEFVKEIVKKVEKKISYSVEKTLGDKVDAILTNKWLGIPIFAAVMFLVFWISQAGPAVWLADLLTGWLEVGQEAVRGLLDSDSIWVSLLVDGIIGGFIAIVGFLPLIMVMYFLLALLEDCGYMARATVVLDPIFKRVGLSGKSVIPFIMGTGCAIPGVMACRTIRDERERRATAMLAPFMPCGAKLPLIALFAGAFFGGSAWVGAAMYFVGILIIFLSALTVNLITGNKAKKSYFIIELPDYKTPSVIGAFMSMCRRGWSYIVKAGTIILVCNFAVHLMSGFGWNFKPAENPEDSILATLAVPVSYMIAPIVGAVSWRLAAAAVTGFIAKENVVATLAVTYGISNLFDLEELSVVAGGGNAVAAAFGISSASALAFLMFNLFTPPCFAAIGAMNAELKSKRWLLFAVGFQLGVGYTVGFIVSFFGGLVTGSPINEPWMLILGFGGAVAFAAALAFMIFKRRRVSDR